MSGELAVAPKETRLATPAPEFSNDQIRLLGETVAKGCDQNELAFFLHVAKLKRLDPFTGQIHVVKRWDSSLGKEKMTVQTGIDGYRVIAARTDDLAGIDDAIYDSEDGEHPNWAKVTVYRYGRNDDRIPYTATARWGEYVQMIKDKQTSEFRPNRMWKTMPFLMLGKVAEALALRKAFPDELSGMYTNEEMEQADSEGPAPQGGGKKPPVQQPTRASEKKQETQPATQQAAQGHQADTKEVSGIIETVKQLKTVWWLGVKGHQMLVRVLEKDVDPSMVAGNFIKFRGQILNNSQVGDFWALLGLMELQEVQDGTATDPTEPASGAAKSTTEARNTAPLSDDARKVADEMFGEKESQGQAVIEDLKKNGQVTTAANLPASNAKRPGTIGTKYAQRLWTIMSQNKKNNNGLTEEEVYRMIAALPNPLTHLRDLEEGMKLQFEKWMTGEEDWHDFWEKD